MYPLITKPTGCTNFSNLFLEWNTYMFRTVSLSIIRSPALYTQHQVYVIQVLLTAASGVRMELTSSSQHNLYDIYLVLRVQCQNPDDGERNCPKHVELHSKNKFEKLTHLVGFVIRIYHDTRSSECQNFYVSFTLIAFFIVLIVIITLLSFNLLAPELFFNFSTSCI